MQQRNDTITIMKAIAIMCMVAGHSLTKTPLEWFVGLFHMPVFFFCSGFCFKEKYLSDSKTYIFRKIKTIWWPTFKWIVVLVLLQDILLDTGVIREEDANGVLVHYYTFKEYVKYIFMGVILHAHAPTFAGIWFLKMLLVATIFGFFIIKYLKNQWFYISLGILLLLSLMMLYLFPGHFPIVDQVHLPFLSTFFFLVGYDFKRKNYLQNICIKVSPIWIFLFCIIILILGYNYWLSSMVSINAIYCVPFCISAIGGIICVYLMSKGILKITPPLLLSYLKYMGNNTYAILMMHILSFKIISLLIVLIYGLSWSRLADFPTIHEMTVQGFWILYFLAGINIPLLAQLIYNKIHIK